MWNLRLFDRNQVELNEGDFVKISDGSRFIFYSEVKYLGDGVLAPFSTFSFHSVEKVKSIPKSCRKLLEDRYNVWYDPKERNDEESKESYEQYLMSWRHAEHMIKYSEFVKVQPAQLSLV